MGGSEQKLISQFLPWAAMEMVVHCAKMGKLGRGSPRCWGLCVGTSDTHAETTDSKLGIGVWISGTRSGLVMPTWESLETELHAKGLLVAMSYIPSANLVSRHHPPIEGTRAPWRNDWCQVRRGKVQDDNWEVHKWPGTSYGARK